jgi:hypothetical protein
MSILCRGSKQIVERPIRCCDVVMPDLCAAIMAITDLISGTTSALPWQFV